jgi:putative tryptophan/tyrosine transport system substrate-binding protein
VKRREFIAGLACSVAWRTTADAQQTGRSYRIGFLNPSGRHAPPTVAFLDELRLNGFIEGQNLEIIPAGFDLRGLQAAEMATTIVKAAPDVIYSGGEVATRAIQAATKTIPIVAVSSDMVAERLVVALARPGGNTTGVSILAPELDSKRLGILIEAVPSARRIAILADANITSAQHMASLREAIRARGVELSVFSVGKPEEIASAMEQAKAAGAGALTVLASPLFGAYPNRAIIIGRPIELQLPAIYEWPEIAEEGGLMAYGPRFTGIFRQAARITAKILRGTKPSEIPVEQPTRFELIINLGAAKAVGLDIPADVTLRAEEVIQ